METADFNVDDFDQKNRKQGDDTLLVKFFIKARQDNAASLKEGRPIFKDVEYVDIKIPGSRTGGACRPARQNDIERFPKHYAAFKNRLQQPDEGTLLSEWPPISRSQAEELTFHNVKTVEQLAGMADVHSNKFMGLNHLREKAKAFLKQAADAAPAAALQEAIAEKDTQIAALTERLNALEENAAPAPAPEPELTSSLDEPETEDITDKPAPKSTRRSRKKVSDG